MKSVGSVRNYNDYILFRVTRMDELDKETDEFEERVEDLRGYVDNAILAAASENAIRIDGLTYTDIDEAIADNPFLLDYGEYAEIIYLRETQEALDRCLHILRRGDFSELEDSIEVLSTYVAHLVDPNQYQMHIDKLQNITEILAVKTRNLERFKEKTIIEPGIILGVSDELMSYFAENPNALYSIEPRLFEEIIAEIFKKFGFKTTLTKKTHDGGYDIFAIEQREFTQNKYIIECKRYAPHRKIDISLVRNLYAVKTHNLVTKALLVTTSTFTPAAIAFQRQHAWELELKEYHDIMNWLQLHWEKS